MLICNFSQGYINSILKIQAVKAALFNLTFEEYTFICGSLPPFYAEKKNTTVSTNITISNFSLNKILLTTNKDTFFIFLERSFSFANFFFITVNNMSNSINGCGFINLGGSKTIIIKSHTFENVYFYRNFYFYNSLIFLFKESVFRVNSANKLIMRNIQSKNSKSLFYIDTMMSQYIFFENIVFFGEYISN